MAEPTVSRYALDSWRKTLNGSRHGRCRHGDCRAALGRLDALIGDGERVPLAAYVGLLENIGRACRPSALAWTTGQTVARPLGNELGGVVLGSRSLGSALHWSCQYFPLVQDISSLKLDVGPTHSTLAYRILDPGIWPRHEDAMFTLGMYAGLVRRVAPDAWSLVQITVEPEQEQVGADLASILGCHVIYGGHANVIRFPSSIVNAPLPRISGCDPDELKRLSAELTRRFRSTDFSDRIRHLIYSQLNDGGVNQDSIARELGMSSRTLRRRLAADGCAFQALLDDCRMRFAALEFRVRRRLSLSDIALRLGYSEHSTFSRAFARWSGMPPQEYRRIVSRNPGCSA